MAGMDMGGASAAAGPSAPARMICGSEVRSDVQRILALDALPDATPSWADRIYTCNYRLPVGPLVLSVQDAMETDAGHRYFTGLRAQLGPTQPLRGLLGLGLPAYETNNGTVVFLKDGKTLTVDATHLPRAAGPDGQSRTEVAYAIAADVVACWSE
ncbi:MAG: hypothetical protein ACR2KL_02045 [Nocardioidaceae bacterium]